MASPHGAGLAALRIAMLGTRDLNGDGLRNQQDVYALRQLLIDEAVTQASGFRLAQPQTEPDTKPERLGWASAQATVRITVVSSPPVADDMTVATSEDTPSEIILGGFDAETCELTFSIVNGPTHGTLSAITDQACISGNPNTDTALMSYTPNPNFAGVDSFVYRITDPEGGFDDATVSITVNPANDAPVAVNDSYSTNEDTTLNPAAPGVLGNDSDVDGNALNAVLVSGPVNGSLSINANGSFSYTPNANFNGPDSFSYKASDGTLESSPATVSITVNSVNDPPAANNLSASTLKDSSVTITLAGSDIENCDLAFAIVTGPANGTLSALTAQACVSGSPNTDSATVTYTPNASYTGSDSFIFSVTDANGASAQAAVSITVSPPADLFVENFEGDVSSWLASGLWHLANNTTCTAPDPGYTSATHSAYYGSASSCNYATSSQANSGILTSRTITGLSVGSNKATLTFKYWRHVEFYTAGSYDRTYAEASYDNGSTWTRVWFKDSTTASEQDWTAMSVSLSPTSSSMKLRFVFSTVDGVDNDQVGLLIDDVVVRNNN